MKYAYATVVSEIESYLHCVSKISSKSIVVILSYTVSKLARFLRHSVIEVCYLSNRAALISGHECNNWCRYGPCSLLWSGVYLLAACWIRVGKARAVMLEGNRGKHSAAHRFIYVCDVRSQLHD